MAYIIRDGKGSINKANVIENRIREFATSVSLMNNVSTETNNVFTITKSVSGRFPFANIIALANGDPNNLVAIDRIILTLTAFGLPTPDPQLVTCHVVTPPDIQILTTPLFSVIDNQATTINPLVFNFTGPSQFPRIMTVYPALGVPVEIIPQNSDGIVLGYQQSIIITILNGTDSPFNPMSAAATMKFAMIPPD